MDECPLLPLQPVLINADARTIQANFQAAGEWAKKMCAYIDQLKARIEALEAGP